MRSADPAHRIRDIDRPGVCSHTSGHYLIVLSMTSQEPILLTPGPLTTTLETKRAMLVDWGSWDRAFNALTAGVCNNIVDIVHAADDYVCAPLQGSGTFSVEAAIGTLVPKDGKILVPVNGAYCRRIVRICEYLGRAHTVLEAPEDTYPPPEHI